MTTDSGPEHAINIVDSIPEDWHVLLWGSLPCTAGSPWQRINGKHEGARAKIDANIEIFESLILNFLALARHVNSRKSRDIANEWPKECDLWSRPEVENMVYEFGQLPRLRPRLDRGERDPHQEAMDCRGVLQEAR